MRRRLRLLALVPLVLLASVFGGWRTAPAPELLEIAATPDRAEVPAGARTRVTVRVTTVAEARPDEAEVPVHVGVVLDTSGSMRGEPLARAQAALHTVVDGMRDGDRLTLVTFDSRAQVLLPATRMDDVDLDEVHARIDAIVAEGTTDLEAGLAVALSELASGRVLGQLERIVLIGDGMPNQVEQLPSLRETMRSASIALTALGVGLDYDEVLLGELARATGGRFHHVDDDAALAEIVAAEVLGAQQLVAAAVRLTLASGPGVELVEVIGAPALPPGAHRTSVVLSDLAAGQRQDVFVELDVTPREGSREVELLDAIVEYDDRDGGAERRWQRTYVAMPVGAATTALALRDPEVAAGSTAARAAAATITAIAMARDGDVVAADALLIENEQRLQTAGGDAPSAAPRLKAQAEQIQQLRSELARNPDRRAVGDDARWRRASKGANAVSSDLLQARDQ